MNFGLRTGIFFTYLLAIVFLLVEKTGQAGYVVYAIASVLLLFASSEPSKPKFVAPIEYNGMKNVGTINGPYYVYSTLTPVYQVKSIIKLEGGVNISSVDGLTASNPPDLVYCYHVLDAYGNHVWPPQK